MSRWHRENPEHYEQFGEPDWLAAADEKRKRQKEEGVCPRCGGVGVIGRRFPHQEPCPECRGKK